MAFGALLALGVVSGAHAQAAGGPGGGPGADSGSGGPPANASQVGEVVVTAQFRAQNLQETPLAITAVTSDLIEARSQSSLMAVAQRAPSVTFTTAGGGLGGSQTTAINIRGIGQSDFNLALEPGVGVYIDDVYYGTVYGSMMNLLDLDRVEVLRGPQGTLAGKNSEGGAVKLYSKAPTAQTNGYLEGAYGAYDRMRLRGGTNITIIPDKLFVRITGIGERETGFLKRYDFQCVTGIPASPYKNIGSMAKGAGHDACLLGHEGGTNVLALRGALRYIVNENIEDTLTVDITKDRSEPSANVLLAQGPWQAPGTPPGTPPSAATLLPNFVLPYGSYKSFATYTGLTGTPYQFANEPLSSLDAWGVSNVLDWKFSDSLSLKSISAFRRLRQTSAVDLDGSPISEQMNLWDINYKQYTEELRLNGKFGEQVNWTLGGFYFRANAEQNGRISIDGATNAGAGVPLPFDFTSFEPIKITSKSAFAHVEYNPIEPLTVTGGVRYTEDAKDFQYGRGLPPGVPASAEPVVVGGVVPVNGLTGNFRGKRWDYRATADYKFTRDINGYVQVATGFKGGGVNPRPFYAPQARPFNPETVTSYEAGLKTFLMDRRIRLNGDVFYNKYKNIQLTLGFCPQFVPAGAPQNCALPANVGDATIKGAEVEAEIHASSALMFDFSGSYLDFKYDTIDPATSIALSMKPPFTPKWKIAAGAQYQYDLSGMGSLTPRVDYQYNSEQYSGAINLPGNRLPPLSLVNARLTYRSEDGIWQVSLEATNVLNKYYFISKFYSFPPYGGGQMQAGILGAPRKWAVTVKRTF